MVDCGKPFFDNGECCLVGDEFPCLERPEDQLAQFGFCRLISARNSSPVAIFMSPYLGASRFACSPLPAPVAP